MTVKQQFMTRMTVVSVVAVMLSACGGMGQYSTAKMAVNPDDFDPFKRYPLGAKYDCSVEHPVDERLNPQNKSSRGLGCSHQSNITSMVANPEHLHTPVAFSPADPDRLRRVLDAYRTGEETGTGAEATGSQPLLDN